MSSTSYSERASNYKALAKKQQKKHNVVSVFRLATALITLYLGYAFFSEFSLVFGLLLLVGLVGFVLLMKWHQRIAQQKKFFKHLTTINQDEQRYLKGDEIPFEDGEEFIKTNHPFAFDLDVFGPKSLFHHLNRTITFRGKQKFASLLTNILPVEEIKLNQQAVQELSKKLDWRQRLTAKAMLYRDNEEMYTYLIKWVKYKHGSIPTFILILGYLFPALFIGLCVYLYVSKDSQFINLATTLFILNLAILSTQIKVIKALIIGTDKIDETIYQYAEILKHIENEKFESEKLQSLQKKLKINDVKASIELAKFSKLLGKLDSISNGIGLILFNGTILYHLHVLYALLKWKTKHATHIESWLEVIAEFESLNSLSNLSFNNPDFSFPELNQQKKILFKDLGHPLLSAKTRINNHVDFSDERFIILTGSNMSGKSTFLRSLGINMLLAGIGSSVCASSASVHPLNIYVSMRLSDSLSDSESYFFAEVKRLKEIMTHLEDQDYFILLDEILRGTNSDDKRNGTIKVIEKLMEKNAVGAIATHDLEVCNTQASFPDAISNKCFEVEIVNNDLHFDYKLRDGVCKNKSASFLMKKMEVI